MKPFHFLLATACLVSGCKTKQPPNTTDVVVQAAKNEAKAKLEEFSGLKSATLQGGELSGGDAQGRPLWRLAAKTIRASGGALESTESGTSKTVTLTDARATLYREGVPESSLQAPRIVLFYLKDGVRLQLSQGVKGTTSGAWTGARGPVLIEAPRADVDVKKRVMSASGSVKMSQGAAKISAQSLSAQTSLENVQLTGGVRAQGAKQARFEAKSALYNWKEDRVTAQQVRAFQGDTRLSGDVLRADTNASVGTLTGQVRAQSAQGQASTPQLDFNWKNDQIRARDAVFTAPQGVMRASSLQTDSKLRVASAQKIILQQDGATLRAASAQGFDGLVRLNAQGIDFVRADFKFSAPRASAQKIGTRWVLVAQGGARAQGAQGKVSAPNVTWDENRGRIEARGGVTLEKDGAVLRGRTLNSDTQFQNATLTGDVRGQMKDGSVLTARTLEKRGERFFARSGATAQLKPRDALGALTLNGAQIEVGPGGASAVATGGVTVVSSTGAKARATHATYNRQIGVVTASGNVDFYDPVRKLRTRGDTLVYNLKTQQATLSNARAQGDLKLFEGKQLF